MKYKDIWDVSQIKFPCIIKSDKADDWITILERLNCKQDMLSNTLARLELTLNHIVGVSKNEANAFVALYITTNGLGHPYSYTIAFESDFLYSWYNKIARYRYHLHNYEWYEDNFVRLLEDN